VQIPIDLYPDINPPFLLLMTNYEGASPTEVENGVTRLREGALTNVNNVQNLTSTSSEGSSMIILEFGWNQDMSAAANDVRDKLEFVKDFLPDDAASPRSSSSIRRCCPSSPCPSAGTARRRS
jgi:HAE1 family hydrophobic/amphiphilic exporter-1